MADGSGSCSCSFIGYQKASLYDWRASPVGSRHISVRFYACETTRYASAALLWCAKWNEILIITAPFYNAYRSNCNQNLISVCTLKMSMWNKNMQAICVAFVNSHYTASSKCYYTSTSHVSSVIKICKGFISPFKKFPMFWDTRSAFSVPVEHARHDTTDPHWTRARWMVMGQVLQSQRIPYMARLTQHLLKHVGNNLLNY